MCDHERALPGIEMIAAMERAFTTYSAGRALVPPAGELLFSDPPGDAHINYGHIQNDEIFVVKVATGFLRQSETGPAPQLRSLARL